MYVSDLGAQKWIGYTILGVKKWTGYMDLGDNYYEEFSVFPIFLHQIFVFKIKKVINVEHSVLFEHSI